MQRWATETRDDPRCPLCRHRLYDLQHYLPESCRESFNRFQDSLGIFKALSEDVDDWLVMGMRQTFYEPLKGLVKELEKCAEGLRGHVKLLGEDAQGCRPNSVLKRLLEGFKTSI